MGMERLEEDRKVSCNVDLGWLWDLPEGVVHVYYGTFYFLGKSYLYDVGGNYTFHELANWMKYGKDKIIDKIEELSETVGKDIKEAKEYIEKHKRILSKYKIKEIYSYTDGGKLKIRLMFEDMSYDYLFGYYFRTNCIYLDSKRLLNILHRVVEKGKNGASEYLKWLEVVNILGKHGITMDWFRYFRIKGDRLILKGKYWLYDWDEGSKLANICEKKDCKSRGNELSMCYESPEVLDMMLEMLE